MNKHSQTNFYVFWKYDLFPYFLGGSATMRDDGTFHIPSFQMVLARKNILAVYPENLGKEIHEQTKEICSHHRKLQEEMQRQAEIKLVSVLPELANNEIH